MLLQLRNESVVFAPSIRFGTKWLYHLEKYRQIKKTKCRLKALLFILCLNSALHFSCENASANEKHAYNREWILCLTTQRWRVRCVKNYNRNDITGNRTERKIEGNFQIKQHQIILKSYPRRISIAKRVLGSLGSDIMTEVHVLLGLIRRRMLFSPFTFSTNWFLHFGKD